MTKKTEQKLVFSSPKGAKITRANQKISDDDNSVETTISTEVVQEQQTAVVNIDNFDEIFPIIDPRELIGHKILKHEPIGIMQEGLLSDIYKEIDLKLPAFRAPCMDPSEEEGKIVFKPGNKPAVGYTSVWWEETWKKFMPSKNSRSGTNLHWAAFMGKQMKYLVDEKIYSVEDAWKAVCNDSRNLGHYLNSKDAKHYFELTGSRKIGLFCDLANTCKFVERWEASGFLLAGGSYNDFSNICPLADLKTINSPNCGYNFSVGWLVLDV